MPLSFRKFFLLFLIFSISQTNFLPIRSALHSTIIPQSFPEIDPSIYTLGVEEGETQFYNLTKAYQMGASSFYIREVGFHIQVGQEFLVNLTSITETTFSYDILMKLANGTYKSEITKNMNFEYHPQVSYSFVITTNRDFIQGKLSNKGIYNFSIQGSILEVIENFWDSGWEVPVTREWIFDLKTGWLMSSYMKAGNDTNLVQEYEIINYRKDTWLMKETGILLTSMPLSMCFLLLAPVLLFYRRRK